MLLAKYLVLEHCKSMQCECGLHGRQQLANSLPATSFRQISTLGRPSKSSPRGHTFQHPETVVYFHTNQSIALRYAGRWIDISLKNQNQHCAICNPDLFRCVYDISALAHSFQHQARKNETLPCKVRAGPAGDHLRVKQSVPSFLQPHRAART